jgi:hypothetical protein
MPPTPQERKDLIPTRITLRSELNELEQNNIATADRWAFSRRCHAAPCLASISRAAPISRKSAFRQSRSTVARSCHIAGRDRDFVQRRIEPVVSTPDEFARFIVRDHALSAQIAEESGLAAVGSRRPPAESPSAAPAGSPLRRGRCRARGFSTTRRPCTWRGSRRSPGLDISWRG